MTGRPLVLCALALLTACRAELYSKVSEREANEMVAALGVSGIEAEKQGIDGKGWSVAVEQGDVAIAVEVLHARGLPKERYESLGEVFKREGLVSTPSEERIRFIYAMSQELSHTLSGITGVVDARVHVVIPANDPLAEHPNISSASVFIKYAQGVDTQAITPAIKNLVTRSIEGLSYDNVSVSFFAAETPPVRAFNRGDSHSLAGSAVALFVLLLLSLGGLSYRPVRTALRRWVQRLRTAG